MADFLYHAVVNFQLPEAGRLSESITDLEKLMPKQSKISPPDHPTYTEVIEVMRRYRKAQDTGAPAIEVERLRLIAESLFQPVTDNQIRGFGRGDGTTQ